MLTRKDIIKVNRLFRRIWNFRGTLSSKLMLIVLVVSVVQLVSSFYTYLNAYREQRNSVITLSQQMLHQANSNYFSYIIQNVTDASQEIFYNSVFWNNDTTAASLTEHNDFFPVLGSKYQSLSPIDSIYLYSSRSNQLYIMDELSFNGIPVKTIGNSIFTTDNQEMSEMEWFNSAIEGKGKAVITSGTGYRAHSQVQFCVSRYVKYPLLNNNYYYVIAFNISSKDIDLLASQICEQGESLLIVDQSKQILYDSENRPADSLTEVMSRLGALDSQNSYIRADFDGEPRIIVTDTSPSNNLTMIKIISEKEMLGDLRHQMIVNSFLYIIIYIIGFVFCITTVNRTSGPIEKLAERMQNYRQNEVYDDRELESRQDEVGVLYRSFNEMNDKMNTLIHSVYESQIQEKQAKLETLQAQLDPHFLYNTLQTISGIAIEKNISEIEEINNSLSKILRYSLNNQKTTVPVYEELEIVEYYMNIQKYRYEGRISLETDLSPEALETMVPVFSLQLGVENAIKHGMEEIISAVRIRIYDEISPDAKILIIENNGKQVDPERLANIRDALSKGYRTESGVSQRGLINLNDRIRQHFGDQYGINIESDEQSTKLIIRVPKRSLNV